MHVYLKISHNQIGMLVEARQSLDAKWQVVELQKYRDFPSTIGWGNGATAISPHKQEQLYLQALQAHNVDFTIDQEKE